MNITFLIGNDGHEFAVEVSDLDGHKALVIQDADIVASGLENGQLYSATFTLDGIDYVITDSLTPPSGPIVSFTYLAEVVA